MRTLNQLSHAVPTCGQIQKGIAGLFSLHLFGPLEHLRSALTIMFWAVVRRQLLIFHVTHHPDTITSTRNT
jgi:hypothetical protein